jgi:hypothetical protein
VCAHHWAAAGCAMEFYGAAAEAAVERKEG